MTSIALTELMLVGRASLISAGVSSGGSQIRRSARALPAMRGRPEPSNWSPKLSMNSACRSRKLFVSALDG